MKKINYLQSGTKLALHDKDSKSKTSQTRGSSETTREPTQTFSFNFDDYITNYLPAHLHRRPKEEIIQFLEWFVGFSEGDGCFERRIADGRPRLSFTVAQMDPQLLYKLKTGLGFGTVRKEQYREGLYRFSVSDKTGIQRLMAIFNGNIILPKVRNRYETWVNSIDITRVLPDFKFRKHTVIPSLETAWISGFSEAEGCFSATLTTPSRRSIQEFRLTQKFSITQKDILGEKKVLEQIRDLFKSNTKLFIFKTDCFRLEITSLESQQCVTDYFCKFCLKGKKKITAFRWWRILLLRSNKVHYESANKLKLKRLVNALNESTKKQVAIKNYLRKGDTQ